MKFVPVAVDSFVHVVVMVTLLLDDVNVVVVEGAADGARCTNGRYGWHIYYIYASIFIKSLLL